MSAMLRRLLCLLSLPVEDGGVDSAAAELPPSAAADLPDASAADDEPTLEDLADAQAAEPAAAAPAAPVETPAERRARERAEQAERELAELRRQAAAAAPRAPTVDPRDAAEDAQIAEAKARGEDTRWLEWQRDTNRRTRQTERIAQSTMQTATDLADSAKFSRFLASNPRFNRFADQVEKHIAENQRNGGPFVSREIVLRLVLGDTLLSSKPKAAKSRADGAAAQPGRVDRGRPAQARSDVTSRQRETEREARRKRLDGVII